MAMIVTVNGMRYRVSFQHSPVPTRARKERRVTSCLITNERGDVVGMGKAECSRADNFNKKDGRKRALGRALENSGMTKQMRTMVWGSYHNRNSQPIGVSA